MRSDPTTFRAMYESPWHHPISFWIAGVAFLGVVVVKRRSFAPFLFAYVVVFALEILADATLTSAWSPLPAGSRAATAASVAFVVLGDARYFAMLARAKGAVTLRGSLALLGLSLVVPIMSYVPQVAMPSLFVDPRRIFLTYEAMFFALALAMGAWIRAWPVGDARRWALRVTLFELTQYALWATADVVILAGIDAGFALRLVPNTMYYVFFLPFVAWSAPRALREPWRAARS